MCSLSAVPGKFVSWNQTEPLLASSPGSSVCGGPPLMPSRFRELKRCRFRNLGTVAADVPVLTGGRRKFV